MSALVELDKWFLSRELFLDALEFYAGARRRRRSRFEVLREKVKAQAGHRDHAQHAHHYDADDDPDPRPDLTGHPDSSTAFSPRPDNRDRCSADKAPRRGVLPLWPSHDRHFGTPRAPTRRAR